jgi:hypothetical protein
VFKLFCLRSEKIQFTLFWKAIKIRRGFYRH